jgi:hypothetical protein
MRSILLTVALIFLGAGSLFGQADSPAASGP